MEAQHLQVTFPGRQVVVVIALVQRNPVGLDSQNPGCHLVEKSPVVGGDEHTAPEGGQVLLEPQVSFQVQVVGRLVQQEHIGLAEEKPGQGGPHCPAAAELADGTGKIGLLESQPGEYRFGLVIPVIAAGGFQGRIQPAQTPEKFILNIGIGFGGQRFLSGGDVGRNGLCLHPRVQHFLGAGTCRQRLPFPA